MGNLPNFIAANSRLRQSDWTVLEHYKTHAVMQNQQLGVLADCYVLTLPPKLNLHTEMEMYRDRKRTDTGLVEVYKAQLLDTSTPHCFSYERTVKVLTEHIPFRLSDFQGLTEADAMWVLLHSLKYFQVLFHRLGYLQPTSKLICFNQKGELKVWVNEDLSANHPKVRHEFIQRAATQKDLMHLSHSEWQMIIKILECVERASLNGRISENFSAALRANRSLTFDSALSMVKDYAQFHRINLTEFAAFKLKYSGTSYISTKKTLTPHFAGDRLSGHSSLSTNRQPSIEISALRQGF